MTRGSMTTPHATSGFRARTDLDESAEALRRVRQAVAHAKDGDRDALRFLYVTYSDNVFGYVRSIVHDDYDAEDVTQHVFAKLITAVAKYDDRGTPFFGWLLRLARNVAIDHLRAARPIPTDTPIETGRADDLDLDRMETVRGALQTLPSEQREVVLLRHLVGLSPGEIAEQMGRSEGSIHGLHHRGRRALKVELTRAGAMPSTRGGRGRASVAAPTTIVAEPMPVAADEPALVAA